MKSVKTPVKERTQSECSKPERFLGWETGTVESLEHAVELCDEAPICDKGCKCKLREAYHFYENERHKEYRR